jgi:hypothetical protein
MRCNIRWDTGCRAVRAYPFSSSQAKRSNPDRRRGDSLDCFVATAPRNDEHPHSRGTNAPGCCIVIAPRSARAQGRPGAACTRSLVCIVESTRVRTTGSTGHPAFPCAMVYGLSRALPGVPGSFATVALPACRPVGSTSPVSQDLIPASGQRRGIRTTRLRRPQPVARSSTAPIRPSHPRPTSVTIAIRP